MREYSRIRELATRETVRSRVTGRNEDGTLATRPQNGECIVRSGIGPQQIGQEIEGSVGTAFSRRGAAGVPGLSFFGSEATIYVASISPSSFELDTSYTVDVVGDGFIDGRLDFQFFGPAGETPNGDVTVDAIRVTDANNAEIDITVAAGAAAVLNGDLGYDLVRPGYSVGEPTRRLVGAWSIVIPDPGSGNGGTEEVYGYVDASLHSTRYDSDGTHVGDLHTVTYSGALTNHGITTGIADDSQSLMGRGTMIRRASSTDLWVWDPNNAESAKTYAATGGWKISSAAYAGGWIWWTETSNGGSTFDARLRKARANLTSVQTVATATITMQTGASPSPQSFVAITNTHVYAIVISQNGQNACSIRSPRSGGSIEHRVDLIADSVAGITLLEAEAVSGVLLPRSNGDAIGSVGKAGSHDSVRVLADDGDLTDDASAYTATGGTGSVHVDRTGTKLLTYNAGGEEEDAELRIGSATGSFGSPTPEILEDHPTHGVPPFAVYFKE